MKSKTIICLAFILSLILYNSCVKLDVINENEPDAIRAFSGVEDYMELAGEAFKIYHNTIQGYASLSLPMAVMADNHTSSWGITRDYSMEPRFYNYVNSTIYSYYFQISGQWIESYKAISDVNLILRWINTCDDCDLTSEQKALFESFSLFVSGVSHGYIGLVFDKAFLLYFDTDLGSSQLKPWGEIIDESLEMLDRAIEISALADFTVPPGWVGGMQLTNIEFAQLVSGYAARILAYSSRTKAKNEALDWTRILNYAVGGMDYDFAPIIGNEYDWHDYYLVFGNRPGWARVDMRVINLMDHDYPSRWPRDNISWNTPDGMDPGEADPDDARLLTDFEYLETNYFPPDRGYYHFSHYRYKRYDYLSELTWYGVGPKPSFLEWEVRLLEAEALFREGNSEGALAILNDPAGPRKVRGGLTDVLVTDDILRYILDEKEIECYNTGADVPYFDMRRTDRLQRGTLLHFPVPAGELQIMNLPVYTIHGLADGIEGSAGGWTGWGEIIGFQILKICQ